MDVKPIRPEEIINNLETIIPSEVFLAINNLLTQKYRGTSVILRQNEIIDEIIRIKPQFNREMIFEKKWLDFEKVYQKNGWNVKYDKPAYSESYQAYFEFSEDKNQKKSK